MNIPMVFGVLGVLGRAKLGTRACIKQIHFARHQVLQVVVVSVEIGLDPVLVQQRQNVFDQFRRVSMFAAGIDRMVADDNFPTRRGRGQPGLKPL